jgi:hypothetical protein
MPTKSPDQRDFSGFGKSQRKALQCEVVGPCIRAFILNRLKHDRFVSLWQAMTHRILAIRTSQ